LLSPPRASFFQTVLQRDKGQKYGGDLRRRRTRGDGLEWPNQIIYYFGSRAEDRVQAARRLKPIQAILKAYKTCGAVKWFPEEVTLGEPTLVQSRALITATIRSAGLKQVEADSDQNNVNTQK
jgi:hypothetical protein